MLALLLLAPVVYAAPPTTEAEVKAHLAELYSPDSAVRLRAADDLVRTPPELVKFLTPTELPCWKGDQALDSPACLYHNHALYHLIRILGATAEKETRPDNPYGKVCQYDQAPTQLNQCPAIDALRWTAANQFTGFVALEDAQLPPKSSSEVRMTTLQLEATRRLDAVLEEEPSAAAWSHAMSVKGPGVRWAMVPRCAGRGMYPLCVWYFALERDGQPTEYQQMRELPAPEMADREELRLTPDGKLAVYLYFGGCCDDDRLHVTVFDLGQKQAPVCKILYDKGIHMPAEQVDAFVAGVKVEGGLCRPPSVPAGATVRAIGSSP